MAKTVMEKLGYSETYIREEHGNICALKIFALWPVCTTERQTKGYS